MEKETVLVTGGNSGIGLECVRELARAGCHVVIASRGRDASRRVVDELSAKHGEGSVEALDLDLASPESIRELAAEVERRDLRLRALVCNAGLQMPGGPVFTPEGYELTFAVNHLGHFLLANLLLDRLLAAAPSRLVVVSSGVHDPKRITGMPKADVPSIDAIARRGSERRGKFSGPLAYVNSKLCNLWFSYEMARRLEHAGLVDGERTLAINAFDPGLVPGSGLAREYHPAARFVWDNVLPGVAAALSNLVGGINPAPKAGAALANLVTDPMLGRPGARYYPSHTRWVETPSSPASYDLGRARELWEASIEMTRLAPGESPLHPAA